MPAIFNVFSNFAKMCLLDNLADSTDSGGLAVLVDIIVIMERQVMLKVKGKHIVSCEQQEDSLPRGRGELLEESVASEEELSCKSSSKVDSTDFALDEELDY